MPAIKNVSKLKSQLRNQKKKAKKNKIKLLDATAKTVLKSTPGKCLGERLLNIVQSLQCGRIAFPELRANASTYIRLATQVLIEGSNGSSSAEDCSLAAGLVTYLLNKSSNINSSTDCQQTAADTHGVNSKIHISPQLLMAFAKEAVKRIGPNDECSSSFLSLFRQLLVTQPGVCLPLRDKLQSKLKLWLNTVPKYVIPNRLLKNDSFGAEPFGNIASKLRPSPPTTGTFGTTAATNRHCRFECVECVDDARLAGVVWATLPVSNSGSGAAATTVHPTGVGGAAVDRGRQLHQLCLTLHHLLDQLLHSVVKQGTSDTGDSAAVFGDVTRVKFPRINNNNKNKNKKRGQKKRPKMLTVAESLNFQESDKQDNNNSDEDDEDSDDEFDGDVISGVELLVMRCQRVMVWSEALVTTQCGGGEGGGVGGEGMLVTPREVVMVVMRVMQVSSRELSQYRSSELQRLALLWPLLQHAALALLHAALKCIGAPLHPCLPAILSQLSNTLDNTHTTATANKDNNIIRHDNSNSSGSDDTEPVNNNNNKHNNTNGVVNGLSNNNNSGSYDTSSSLGSIPPPAAEPDIVCQQHTVYWVYRCLTQLVKCCGGVHGLPLAVARAVVQDTALQAEGVQLQLQSTKSIASLSIKKKSKHKGYSVVSASAAAATKQAVAMATNNAFMLLRIHVTAAFGNGSPVHGAGIVTAALELLETLFNGGQYTAPHYVLEKEVVRLLQSSLVTALQRYSLLSLRPPAGGATLLSMSGRVNITGILRDTAVLAKLVGVVGSICSQLHPTCPPPVAVALRLVERTAALHHHSQEVVCACVCASQRLRTILINPRVELYLRGVEEEQRGAETTELENEDVMEADEEESEADEEESEADEEESEEDDEESVVNAEQESESEEQESEVEEEQEQESKEEREQESEAEEEQESEEQQESEEEYDTEDEIEVAKQASEVEDDEAGESELETESEVEDVTPSGRHLGNNNNRKRPAGQSAGKTAVKARKLVCAEDTADLSVDDLLAELRDE